MKPLKGLALSSMHASAHPPLMHDFWLKLRDGIGS